MMRMYDTHFVVSYKRDMMNIISMPSADFSNLMYHTSSTAHHPSVRHAIVDLEHHGGMSDVIYLYLSGFSVLSSMSAVMILMM